MARLPAVQFRDDPLQRSNDEPPAPAVAAAPEPEPAAVKAEAPKRERAPAPRRSSRKPSIALADESEKAVFGRVPRSLARRLEGAVFELKAERDSATQQEVLAALLWKYVDPLSKSAITA